MLPADLGQLRCHRIDEDPVLSRSSAEILRIATEHGARHVRAFGSRARGEGRADSHIDLLLDLEAGRSLLDLISLDQAIEDLTPKK